MNAAMSIDAGSFPPMHLDVAEPFPFHFASKRQMTVLVMGGHRVGLAASLGEADSSTEHIVNLP